MNNDSLLIRQWRLLMALVARPAGVTVANFATEHGVSRQCGPPVV